MSKTSHRALAYGTRCLAYFAGVPRGLFTCVIPTRRDSGKSTLVQDTLGLYPDEVGTRLMYEVYGTRTTWAAHDAIEGFEGIDKVIDIDQSPIGRTPRSPDGSGFRTLSSTTPPSPWSEARGGGL